jgi:hypothetical protein
MNNDHYVYSFEGTINFVDKLKQPEVDRSILKFSNRVHVSNSSPRCPVPTKNLSIKQIFNFSYFFLKKANESQTNLFQRKKIKK